MLGMRTSLRAMAAFVTPPYIRMSSLRLPDQPNSGHRHAPLATATAGLVLGSLLGVDLVVTANIIIDFFSKMELHSLAM